MSVTWLAPTVAFLHILIHSAVLVILPCIEPLVDYPKEFHDLLGVETSFCTRLDPRLDAWMTPPVLVEASSLYSVAVDLAFVLGLLHAGVTLRGAAWLSIFLHTLGAVGENLLTVLESEDAQTTLLDLCQNDRLLQWHGFWIVLAILVLIMPRSSPVYVSVWVKKDLPSRKTVPKDGETRVKQKLDEVNEQGADDDKEHSERDSQQRKQEKSEKTDKEKGSSQPREHQAKQVWIKAGYQMNDPQRLVVTEGKEAPSQASHASNRSLPSSPARTIGTDDNSAIDTTSEELLSLPPGSNADPMYDTGYESDNEMSMLVSEDEVQSTFEGELVDTPGSRATANGVIISSQHSSTLEDRPIPVPPSKECATIDTRNTDTQLHVPTIKGERIPLSRPEKCLVTSDGVNIDSQLPESTPANNEIPFPGSQELVATEADIVVSSPVTNALKDAESAPRVSPAPLKSLVTAKADIVVSSPVTDDRKDAESTPRVSPAPLETLTPVSWTARFGRNAQAVNVSPGNAIAKQQPPRRQIQTSVDRNVKAMYASPMHVPAPQQQQQQQQQQQPKVQPPAGSGHQPKHNVIASPPNSGPDPSSLLPTLREARGLINEALATSWKAKND